MLSLITHKLQHTAARTARTAALGAGAMAALSVGLGFMTLAAWLLIVSVAGALMAAFILGAFYMGLGLVLVAIMSSHRRRPPPPDPAVPSVNTLLAAFMAGMTAGKKARS